MKKFEARFSSSIALTVVAAAFFGTPVGCKKDSEASASGSAAATAAKQAICDKPKLNTCDEYSGEAFAAGEDLLKTGCSLVGGTYATNKTCPPSELGVCKQSGGTSSKYYKGAPNDMKAKDGKEKCSLYNGTWAATPQPPSGPFMCDERKKGAFMQECKTYSQQNVEASGGEDAIKERCAKKEGTFSKGTCPADGVIGTCDQKDDGVTSYYKGTSKSDAKEFCALAQGTLSMK